jgi:hypothetical protein
MESIVKELGFLLGLATVLLLFDRYVRIQPILRGGAVWSTEGMAGGSTLVNGTTSRLGSRCGTDIGGCGESQTCANGFCISQSPPALREKYPLPVLPSAA